MEGHIRLLGILYIALGGLVLLGGGVLFVILAGAGALSEDATAFTMTTIIGLVAALFFVVIAVPSIVAGMGLMRFRPWARLLSIVLGALHLFNVPFGTLLGIYSFWALLNPESERLFAAPRA